MNNLSITLLNTSFKNPLFLPSGIITDIPAHKKALDKGIGALFLKTITLKERKGYPLPRVIKYEHGVLNAVGLRNPGLVKAKKQIKSFIKKTKLPIFLSVFAVNVSDFQKLVAQLAHLKPVAIELNLSCPHLKNEFGPYLSSRADTTYEVTKAAKKEAGDVPIICKLSPNTTEIDEIGKACEAAGADAISAINTVGPGMVIDIKKRKPILGNKKGGVSGPGIRPIAVAKIYEIYEAVKIPILGMGGVVSGKDVIEMMMAGASLVGAGTAVYMKGYGIYKKILEEIKEIMEKENIKNLTDIIGVAH